MSTARWIGGPFRAGGRGDRAVAGAIAAAAVVLVVGAVLDFVGGGSDHAASAIETTPATEMSTSGDPVEFHRLLPDATNAVGRVARVDGTVAEVESDDGFWVRDLRGHTVFVAVTDPSDAAGLARGDAVRVVGRVELVPPAAVRARDTARDERATGAQIVRGVELAPIDGGVDRLGNR